MGLLTVRGGDDVALVVLRECQETEHLVHVLLGHADRRRDGLLRVPAEVDVAHVGAHGGQLAQHIRDDVRVPGREQLGQVLHGDAQRVDRPEQDVEVLAVVALGVTDIVICGHSNCGAMKAIATCQCLDPMPAVSHWLRYSDAAKAVVEKKTWANETDKVNGMVQENVIAQLNNIKTHPSVAVGLRDSTLRLHGWFYDIESGDIRALDKNSKTFVSLSENPDVYFE